MTGRSVKAGSRLGLSVRTEGRELEIETGRHRTDESEELRWAPRVVDSDISRNGMLAAGFGDPVLMVRPHSARPPDRSGRTVGKRRPTLGHPLACTVDQARAFTGGSASIHCRILFGDVQRDPRSTAHGAPLYFRAIVSPWGIAESRIPCPLESATSSVSHADGCCPFSSRRTVTSTHIHAMRTPRTDDGRIIC